MKFKLDENLGTKMQELFREAGYDVETVCDEKLQGSSDEYLYRKCCAEHRCLITLDLDFANPLRFPPGKSSGIAVIRIPVNPSHTLLKKLVLQFMEALSLAPIEKELWIIEAGRIRIHQSEN